MNDLPELRDQGKMTETESSREFLRSIGISGEIIHTPSHSTDSISIILDDGSCFVGDLEPIEYLAAYDHNTELQGDWEHIKSYEPRHIYYAHANDKEI